MVNNYSFTEKKKVYIAKAYEHVHEKIKSASMGPKIPNAFYHSGFLTNGFFISTIMSLLALKWVVLSATFNN